MTARRYRPVLIGAGVLIVAAMTLLWLKTRSVDSAKHEAIIATMRSLDTLDHALNEQVLKIRFGLNASYDDVSAAEGNLDRLKSQLESGAFPVSDAEARAIQDRVQRYTQLQLEKSRLIEEFKSENACLRNSLTFFPTAAERAGTLAEAETDPAASGTRALIYALQAHTPAFALGGDSDVRAKLEADLAAVHIENGPPRNDLERALRALLVHAQSIHDHKARADSVLETVLSLPTRARADELLDTYNGLHSQAARASDAYRAVLYGVCVLLAAYGAWAFVRVGRSARELSKANETLEQRVAERTSALEEASHAAQEATRAKSAFLANMSHEIRTPMTAILGYADLMVDHSQTPSERLDSIQTIRRNAAHLLALINDILDLSKIEAGKMTVEEVEMSPVQVVTDVAMLMRGRAAEKGLAFAVEYRGPFLRMCRSDPTRLRQILLNLVGNAIKFTQSGGVRIVCSLITCAEADQNRIRFDVIDTGIGLTNEQQSRLFGAFVQADASTSRKFGGTGLGLNISRRLAQMLGGDIFIHSVVNEGSMFSVEVRTGPIAEGIQITSEEAMAMQPASRPVEAPLPSIDGARILLAEDGPDNQRLLTFVLRKAGAQVTLAENGRIALETALASRPFDAILMDMQMPEMDGYTAARRLRSNGYEGPIIALTANAMAGDRDLCLNAGCDDYATKPIDRRALLEAVSRCLRESAAV
jgi:signal transduction histidine kinase